MASKKSTTTPTFVGGILKKVAPQSGAKVLLEPEWKVVGQITFKNGLKRYFRSSNLDINPAGAAAIAKDKAHANFFMQKMGYPSIPSQTFFSDSWAAAIGSSRKIDESWKYAEKIGLPVIVKPNSGARGRGVALVHTKQEFYRAMRTIFEIDDVALVQKQVKGKDYRVVVFDTKIIAAYERVPLQVVGDGRSSILQLLQKKQRSQIKSGRDSGIKIDDPRIIAKLKKSRRMLDSILKKDESIMLLDNANLSAGGEAVDVTDQMHSSFKRLAITLTKDMGLRLCGVDLMVDGDIREKSDKAKSFHILEINAFPGLDHYAHIGKAQMKKVEDLYFDILKKLERS